MKKSLRPGRAGVLRGTSQSENRYCHSFKNLAFLIEPPVISIRPTLRDGH